MSSTSGADPRAPRRRDLVLAGVLVAVTFIEAAVRPGLRWPLAVAIVTAVLLAALPWVRRYPLAVVLATTAASTALATAQASSGIRPEGMATMFALLLGPYALFRWDTRTSRVIGSAALAVGVLVSAVLGSAPGTERVIGAIAGLLFVGTTCLIGALVRERASSRQRLIAMARAEERASLARDLHDTVAHHVSAIAIRAQAAAAVSAGGSPVVDESLRVIEQEASAALDEMRVLVRALREPADYAPARTLADLATLATDGPPIVSVRVDVTSPISELIAATLYRVAQEAVTNARRHAVDVRRIDVDIHERNGALTLSVIDDGISGSPTKDGFGLRGIAERVALLGGELDAGPIAGAGWSLRASIPRGVA